MDINWENPKERLPREGDIVWIVSLTKSTQEIPFIHIALHKVYKENDELYTKEYPEFILPGCIEVRSYFFRENYTPRIYAWARSDGHQCDFWDLVEEFNAEILQDPTFKDNRL